jgi:hypothetical protein
MLSVQSVIRPNHYVVVETEGKRERVAFGIFLPLSKRAASQYAKAHVKGEHRVIMRKTAIREKLLNY